MTRDVYDLPQVVLEIHAVAVGWLFESMLRIKFPDNMIPVSFSVLGGDSLRAAVPCLAQDACQACLLYAAGEDPAAQQEVIDMDSIARLPGKYRADKSVVTEPVTCMNGEYARFGIGQQALDLGLLESPRRAVELISAQGDL